MISVTMLASSIARRLPQIPLEQCKSLLAEFRDQVRAYGLGERLWQCHAGEFAMMTGDLTALEEHLERFRAAERDDVSDCAVCETGAMAEYLLALGRRTEAVALVEDLLQKKEFCEEQPWKFLSILTDDALDRNDLQEAERFSAAMVIQPIKTAAVLRRVGTLLQDEGILRRLEGRIEAAEKRACPGRKISGTRSCCSASMWGQPASSGPQPVQHTEVNLPLFPASQTAPKTACMTAPPWPGGSGSGRRRSAHGLTAATAVRITSGSCVQPGKTK